MVSNVKSNVIPYRMSYRTAQRMSFRMSRHDISSHVGLNVISFRMPHHAGCPVEHKLPKQSAMGVCVPKVNCRGLRNGIPFERRGLTSRKWIGITGRRHSPKRGGSRNIIRCEGRNATRATSSLLRNLDLSPWRFLFC